MSTHAITGSLRARLVALAWRRGRAMPARCPLSTSSRAALAASRNNKSARGSNSSSGNRRSDNDNTGRCARDNTNNSKDLHGSAAGRGTEGAPAPSSEWGERVCAKNTAAESLASACPILSSPPNSTEAIESRHPSLMDVDPATVSQGLRLNNAAHCPFLKEVEHQIETKPAVHEALRTNRPGSGRLFKAVIDDALVTVLKQLREQKRYREFLYFKRSVGQHPEVVHTLHTGHNQYLGRAEEQDLLPRGVTSQPHAFASSSSSPSSSTVDVEGNSHQRATRVDSGAGSPSMTTDASPTERVVVNWCSNDYLNMAHHPAVISAMQRALIEQGAGAGGTRNIAGSNVMHVQLETELAALCDTEAALLFNSCYAANLGVMEALASSFKGETIIFSDQENHASLVQGIRNTRLPKRIFRHNDMQHLEQLLREAPESANKVVVFESVYSMSGTMGPISAILDLCEEYGALSVVDEVHAIGLYGEQGGGILDMIGQRGRADIITGTLGKAFGVSGGFVSSKSHIIDVIRSTAPSFIFTTSMSPVVAAGALASVQHVRQRAEDRAMMMATCSRIKQRMLDAHLPLMSTQTHIMPLLIGDGSLCKQLSDELLERGIYVQPINYPSVPKGEELLRFTAGPKHTEQHISHLLSCLTDLFSRHGLLTTQRDHPKLRTAHTGGASATN